MTKKRTPESAMSNDQQQQSLEEKIEAINLHSLRLIHLLCENESLAQTAAIMSISVSKASRDLSALRQIFGDELFIRSGARMVPTVKMNEIQPRIRLIFEVMGGLFEAGERYDPSQANGLLRIAASDNAFTVCVAPFLPEISAMVPNVRIEICPPSEGTVEAMQKGDVDLLIAHDPFLRLGDSFYRSELLTSPHAVVMRRGHPFTCETLHRSGELHSSGEWREALAPWRLMTTPVKLPSGFSRPNEASDAVLGEPPVKCPYFISVLLLTAQTDKVMVCAEVLAEMLSSILPVQYRVLEDEPAWEPAMHWHQRTHGSPLHQWLRSMFRTRIRERYGRFCNRK